MPKRIALLGSTGSIGTQSLDVISRFPDQFAIEVLTAGNNIDLLIQQASRYKPDSVVIANESHYKDLKEALSGYEIRFTAGLKQLIR